MGNARISLFGCMLFVCSCHVSGQQYNVELAPEFPTTHDIVTLTVSGSWPDSCVPDRSACWVDGQTVYFNVYHSYIPDICLAVVSSWSHMEHVGPLSEGTYPLYVRQTDSNWSHVADIIVSDHQIILLDSEIDVPEGGTSSVGVRLLNPPRSPESPVSISVSRVSGDEDICVKSGSSLFFDSSNYAEPQMVIFEAREDSDYFSNSARFSFQAQGYLTVHVVATEVDNDRPPVFYVDANAKGANDGTSWDDAFDDLQNALSAARLTAQLDEIRIAGGTYKPALAGGNPHTSFEPVSNVWLKGGYAGVAYPHPDYRNTDLHATVLSGDLNGDDGADFTNRTDNVYCVIRVERANAATLLDGLRISGGGNENTWGGGGVFIRKGSLVMDNCVVSRNQANYGAGIHIQSGPALLRHCVIADNSSTVSLGNNGSGIYVSSEKTIRIESCTIAMNKSGENCAGLRAVFTSPILRNSIIWGNEVSNGPAAAAQIDCKSYDARYCCIQDLQPHLRVGGNIAADPLFADSAAGDYHLKSQGGRYDPAAQVWVTDEVTSPAIDAGDPLAPIGTEPFANGGIINIGAYGQTAQASKAWFGTAPCQTIVAGDINGDCTVNLADMAILSRHWLTDFGQ